MNIIFNYVRIRYCHKIGRRHHNRAHWYAMEDYVDLASIPSYRHTHNIVAIIPPKEMLTVGKEAYRKVDTIVVGRVFKSGSLRVIVTFRKHKYKNLRMKMRVEEV